MANTIDPQSSASNAPVNNRLRTLSDDLQLLVSNANGRTMSLGRMIDVLGDRGHAVLIIILTAPFLVLPIPGISTAFGIAILMLGMCVMLNIRPWLPGFVRRREISNETLHRLVMIVERVLSKVERLLRPRLRAMTAPRLHWLIGLSLSVAAVALALPIPIPWNNVPPAVVLMLLAFGLLEQDGLAVLIGHILNLLLWTTLFFIGDFLMNSMPRVWQKLT